MKEIKDTIKYEDFSKVDIRVGTVLTCEKIEKSEKLLILKVDFGELGTKQILTGMAKWYTSEDFVNKQFPFVLNMETRTLMGYESQGMLLGVGNDLSKAPVLLAPESEVTNGDGVL